MNRVFINLTLTIWIILAAIFIKEISTYRTSKKENQFDEYYVEHEISTIEAKNSALSIDLKSRKYPPTYVCIFSSNAFNLRKKK